MDASFPATAGTPAVPATMRAFGFARYGGPDVLEYYTAPVPTPGPGQLLVRVLASGLNPADIKVRAGKRAGVFDVTFPMAMGRELSGTVVARGAEVTGFAVGDAVFGSPSAGVGSLAEYTVLDAAATVPVPPSLSAVQAACVPVAVGTALDVLDHLYLAPGDVFVVIGAGGGVGSAACQLAVSRGARVIGVASEGKHDLVAGLGARPVASGDGWVDRVRAEAGGPVVALLDMVGGDVLHEALDLGSEETQVVSIADPVQAGKAGGGGVTRRRTREAYATAARLVVDGAVRPLIRTEPFSRAAEAYAEIERGHVGGKIVVTFDAE
ncbi:NADP-dependent oxidoreductase [Raineyella sp. LH-20]|uniref:NADP-dependent oxidoreductase n=1 Tax=Raineyella sp. LH-20 TaxID=3081204 RepID=UPI002954E0DB|nr:NADP-dependent oxidoreductase [Raineyella sp. LH-20]WOP19359.1 NADP-dependent oxidoreductase [Raineyella sp. LH-20]